MAHRELRSAVKIDVGKDVPVHDIGDARDIGRRNGPRVDLVEDALRRGLDQRLRIGLIDLRVRRTAEHEQCCANRHQEKVFHRVDSC